MKSLKYNNAESEMNETQMVHETFSPRIRQLFLAAGPIIITLSFGIAEGFSAITLPQLEDGDSIPIDENLGSWIASITALAMSIGCIIGGWLMEVIGRRGVHLAVCVPSLISWLMIYFSSEIGLLLTGRCISGLCIGIVGPSSAVYFAELSDPEFRGFLLGSLNTAMTSGIMLAHIMGTFLPWRTVALITCAAPLACAAVMVFVPESASYLARKKKIEEAKKAFHWARGYGPEAQKELDEIIKRHELLCDAPKRTFKHYIDDIRKPEFCKPLLILLLFFTFMQWSGHNGIAFYSVTIAKQTMGGTVDEYLTTIFIDVVRIIAACISCFLLKTMMRRTLLWFTGGVASLFFITLGLFVHFSQFYPSLMENYSAVPLTSFIAAMAILTLGFIPLPWAMAGELFPLANRGLGSGITTTYNYFLVFLVVKATPSIFSGLGADGAFLLFGSVVLGGTLLLMLILPETSGVPLHEIEDSFKKKNIVEA